MIHLKKAFKEKIFVRFMTSYLLVLFIPLIVGLIAYNEALKIVEHDSKEASLSTLEQGMVVLDSRLSEIENMVTQLALNYKVLGFAREYSPYVDGTVPCKINDIREQLAPLTVNNKFISNLYIYFNRSDVMISPNSSYINLDCFYGGIFQYGNMSNADWRENVLNNKFNKKYFPVNQVYLRTDYDTNKLTNSSMIMYVQSFPFGKLDKGQIIVLLSKSKIEELFEDVSIKQGGWAYILDNDGEVITTISSSGQYINVIDIDPIESKGCMVEKVEDQKVIMTYVKSPYNGWRYVAVLPYHKVMEKVLYIKQIIITIFMVSLLIGIVCAYLLTCRNYKPILNIVNTIKELMGNNVGEKENEYALINGSILDLVKQNRNLGSKLEKQLPLLKAAFIQKLLLGDYKNTQEIELLFNQIDIKHLRENIAVIIVCISDYYPNINADVIKEMSAIKVILMDVISKYLETEVYYHDLDFDKRVVLFQVEPHIRDNDINQILNKVLDEIYNDYKISLFCAVGSLADDFNSINKSFEEAKEVLNYKIIDKKTNILWYSQGTRQKETYYYPLSLEVKLLNYARVGNWNDVEKIINEIYRENFIRRNIPTYMVKHLINEIMGTMIKTLYMLPEEYEEDLKEIEMKIYDFSDYRYVDEMFSFIFHTYNEICNLINDEKKNENKKVIDAVIDYINSNYMDTQISLVCVADKFGLSGAYLSQLFKENTGENFSVYLQKVRINKACDLLVKGKSVTDVAEEVGYSSVYVFRRAFKRVLGVNPSEYKEQLDIGHKFISIL